jgi:uncharacterized membrane protein HdeD (DUF308 family)
MATHNSASSERPVRARHAADDAGGTFGMSGGDQSWVIMLVGAIVTFVLGVVVLVWPKATIGVIAVLLGIQLLIFGIVSLIAGFTRGEGGGMRIASIMLGLLGVAAGLYCIRHLSVTAALLAFLVGLFWALHGIVDLVFAVAAGPVPGRWFKAVAGVISLAAGLIVIFEPKASLKFLLVVLGIYLVLYGVLLAVEAMRERRSQAALS